MTIFENDIQEITTIMRKPVSNHLRILLYREIPSLMNRTSKRMPPRRFVTPRSDGIFRARIRSRIRTYAQNVYNAIHFHLYTWLEYRRCAWARGKEGERRMIRFRIRWHQANPRIGWRGIVRLDASWNTSNVQAHCLILTLVTRALCRRIFTSRITRVQHASTAKVLLFIMKRKRKYFFSN